MLLSQTLAEDPPVCIEIGNSKVVPLSYFLDQQLLAQKWPISPKVGHLPDIFSAPAIARFSFASYWQSQRGDTPQLHCHP